MWLRLNKIGTEYTYRDRPGGEPVRDGKMVKGVEIRVLASTIVSLAAANERPDKKLNSHIERIPGLSTLLVWQSLDEIQDDSK